MTFAGALVANGLLLLGLLAWDWSIWTAIAALWVENLIEMPFLARRIARALDVLPEADLATYLRPDKPPVDVHEPGFPLERLRRILVGDPPATDGRGAARNFVFFWIPFLAVTGLFVATIGWVSAWRDRPGASALEAWPFDEVALLAVAGGVLAGELATIWLDRRGHPLMPDTSGFERRFIILTVIVVLAGWVFGLIGPASRLIAAAFVVMKAVGDLRAGYRPQRFEAPAP